MQQPPELHEISRILTKGVGPEVDAAKGMPPAGDVDPSWNPRGVWLLEYRQTGQAVNLLGEAKTRADIVELKKRLWISRHFDDVHTVTSEEVGDRQLGNILRFELEMKSRNADPATAPIKINSW